MKVHTRKTTTSRRKRRQNSSALYSSSSSSSLLLNRAMMTLLVLFFGTLFADDVFVVVRATWPIVRYKNGTVGVKNDGGTVQVQSTDLLVDGNLSVSGSLFVQDRDLAEYEERVSFLEKALGDPALLNLSNCSSVTYRSPTAYPKEATEWDYLSIPPVVSGTTQFSLSWTDIKSICTHKGYILCSSETFCTNYVPPSALDIPEHDSWIAVGDSENEWLTFRRGWNNRICKTHTEVAGSKPSWGTSNSTSTTGDMYRAGLCCSVGDTSESMCISNDNNTTTSVVSQLQSLKPPTCMRPGGAGLFFNGTSWICECVQSSTHVYYGANCENICIQNVTQFWNTTTSSCQQNSYFTMIGENVLYQDDDGWILLLAYNHKAGENNALVSKTAPSSPTEGYSHIWLEDLGLTASDVDSVKFYCKTSAHSRVMHFSSSTDWVKNAIVTGGYPNNKVSYWTSGTTKFDDHTAYLPDATQDIVSVSLVDLNFIFVQGYYHWNIGTNWDGELRWECDDYARNTADTLHQIWFKQVEKVTPFYGTVFPTCTLIGDTRPSTLVPFGDYDGNGLLDVIEHSEDKSKISVRLQTSARTFASETTVLISELSGEKVLRPESVGDFTNDGKEDIVLLGGGTTWGKNRGSSDVFYASNPSSWLPWTVSEQSNTKWGNRMATGDFNDDGWLDVVTNNIYFSDSNDVYINTKATASIGVQVKSLANTGTFSHDVVVGDMDGDSNLDVIFVSSDSGGDYVIYGDGNGSFGDKWRFDGGSRGALAVCDFDGDGRLDVATGDYWSALKVHYTAGASSYSRTSLFSRSSTISEASNYIYGMDCADVNHDGWPDLIVSGAKVSVFINQGYKGESNFIVKDGQQIIFDQKPSWGSDHLTLKDMDGDGSLDLVTPWHICWNNAGN